MEIAMGAIGPLLPKLGNLLVGEFTLEKRVRKGVESLITELTLMYAALRKVGKVPPDQLDDGVKIWAENVKELSYQMEDIVDSFVVRIHDDIGPANPKNRVKKLLKKTIKLFQKGKDLHQISGALEEAVGQAKQLAELRQRYEQEICYTATQVRIDPRVMALYNDVTELVGIEGTRDELINLLIMGDDWLKHPLKTVSIVGFGGLGKTTLAKAAYDKIKVQFDCCAFVSVSQSPDMKKILKNILFELDKKMYANIYEAAREEKHLIDELIEFLTDKRYLIVIDDIWDESAWQLIKCAFKTTHNNLGSRLITTTRITTIAEACCSFRHDIYKMKPLSNDVSRRLFYKRVFSREKGCPDEFVQVSEDILRKCGGIPLAIITIASLLASSCQIKTKDQWWVLLNSIGRGLTEDRSVEEMKNILLLSYYDLPSHLKPCLLYLSIFPEDHNIMRGNLIWRWIAEGFVYSERQETSLYELGECYFNELVNRNMIQPVGIDGEERVEACRVHDMVLDIIRSLSSEENFATILDGTKRKVLNSQSKVRRLSILKLKVDVTTTSMAQVRSISIFTSDIFDQMPLVSSSEVLRVLDLESCSDSVVGYVCNLLHLRYLRLNGTNVKELPMEIGKLQFLQTLNLRTTRSIKQLPSSIVCIRNLMSLYIHEGMKLPRGMDNLTSLEVLCGLQVGQLSPGIFNLDIVKELCYLTKLRVLEFTWPCLDESMSKALVKSLSNLHKLESLNIMSFSGRIDLMREGWMPPPQLRRLCFLGPKRSLLRLPAWINVSSLHFLAFLSIRLDEPRPEDIRLFGMLPALRYLHVAKTGAYTCSRGREPQLSAVTTDAFPRATELHFFNIPVVPSMFPPGAAPMLKSLVFSFPAMWVAHGDTDYLSLGHFPYLENVGGKLLCEGASASGVNEAEAALRAAVEDHPNRPQLHIYKF